VGKSRADVARSRADVNHPTRRAKTARPTDVPTESPTDVPTESPTEAPTESPTDAPTESPTEFPTDSPTNTPSRRSTGVPTLVPTPTSTVPTMEPHPTAGHARHGIPRGTVSGNAAAHPTVSAKRPAIDYAEVPLPQDAKVRVEAASRTHGEHPSARTMHRGGACVRTAQKLRPGHIVAEAGLSAAMPHLHWVGVGTPLPRLPGHC
jgi:hypothetical protein